MLTSFFPTQLEIKEIYECPRMRLGNFSRSYPLPLTSHIFSLLAQFTILFVFARIFYFYLSPSYEIILSKVVVTFLFKTLLCLHCLADASASKHLVYRFPNSHLLKRCTQTDGHQIEESKWPENGSCVHSRTAIPFWLEIMVGEKEQWEVKPWKQIETLT